MNCEFCHHVLAFSHFENLKEVEIYDCKNCPILVSFAFFVADGLRIKTIFCIDRNQRLYIWTNNYLTNQSYINEVYYKTRLDLQSEPFTIRFPRIMSLTPDNVKDKLALCMVFS